MTFQAHDEEIQEGSTTKGSFLEGRGPEHGIEALAAMTKGIFPIKKNSKIQIVKNGGINQEILEAFAISIMTDESQTCDKKEMMAFVVKLVDRLGRVKIRLLAMKHVKDLSAEGLFKVFKEVVQENGITGKQLQMVNTDGAPAMLSEFNGLHGKVKKEFSNILWVHCVAHRLALAIKQALEGTKKKEGVSGFKKVVTKHSAVRKFVYDSSKCVEKLKSLAEKFNDAPRNVLKLHAVRWLSLFQVHFTLFST